jgi:hypothetical protein
MEEIIDKHFPKLICAKEQGNRPSTQFKLGKTPQSSDPCPAHGLPREGGGQGPASP